MIHRWPRRLLPAIAACLWALPANACPEPGRALLFHSCQGPSEAAILLLPEETPDAAAPQDGIAVTGAYTAREPREDGKPAPVGLFVDGGTVVTPHLAPMDGILLIDAEGRPSLHHRRAVSFAGRVHDLADLAERRGFAEEASRAGASVMQSHLVIVDGVVDVRPREDAPRFVRRMLFTDAEGYGLWQSPEPMTLHEAAERLAVEHSPAMALNLDMGSFDYCRLALAGTPRRCGLRSGAETAGLSNLLVLTLH